MVRPPAPALSDRLGSGPQRRTLRLSRPLDLRLSLRPLRHGPRDPSTQLDGDRLWRATRTPAGPATELVSLDRRDGSVTATAWGPGAEWLLDALPDLVGEGDDLPGWTALAGGTPTRRPPGWEVVAELARRHPGLRIPRTRAVYEASIPSILEQKVTGIEATRSYRELLGGLGEPAPGPVRPDGRRLLLPPPPRVLAGQPSWALHRYGISRRRAETLRRAGSAARRLEEATAMAPPDAARRLQAVPGLGPWTAAEVALVALGDADAVGVGDFHFPHQVAWKLAGLPRGDDTLMLELLEPWRGHRGRVIRLLMAEGVTAPKFGPKQPLRSFRGY